MVAARLASLAAAVLCFAVLEGVFLGLLAGPFFRAELGALAADPVQPVPALIFYVAYLGALYFRAIRSSDSVTHAAIEGAWIGAIGYGTFELTAWAVIANYPATLVPVDILWGIVLSSSTGAVGKAVEGRLRRSSER